MKTGICSWAFAGSLRGNRRVEELARIAKETGFDYLEGAFNPRGFLGPGSPPPDRPLSLPLYSLATLQLHRFHLTDPRPERRAIAFEIIQNMIDCAEMWAIRSISFSPGPLYPGQGLAEVLEQSSRQLGLLVERASRFGCQVALENVPGHCLVTCEAMSLALNKLGPNVGICLDIGNTLLDPPFTKWVEEFQSKIVKIHLSDGLVDSGALKPLLPGQGEVSWKEVREGVDRIRCEFDLFVEAPLPAGMPEAVFLRRLRRAVRDVWE